MKINLYLSSEYAKTNRQRINKNNDRQAENYQACSFDVIFIHNVPNILNNIFYKLMSKHPV